MNAVLLITRRREVRKTTMKVGNEGVVNIHWDSIALDLGDIERASSSDLDILYVYKFLASIHTKNLKGSETFAIAVIDDLPTPD